MKKTAVSHLATSLPEGYAEICKVDLQKDKKKALLLNVLAFAIFIVMCVPMHFVIPFSTIFSFEEGMVIYFLRFAIFLVGSIVYIVLHELTHAAVMKRYGAKKVRFGYTGLYAFAGSEQDYFDRFSYIQIALAPLVTFGILLTVICFIVPPNGWFWVVYLIQASNVSGAMGDVYVTLKFLRMPKGILIKDTGTSMTVYAKIFE